MTSMKTRALGALRELTQLISLADRKANQGLIERIALALGADPDGLYATFIGPRTRGRIARPWVVWGEHSGEMEPMTLYQAAEIFGLSPLTLHQYVSRRGTHVKERGELVKGHEERIYVKLGPVMTESPVSETPRTARRHSGEGSGPKSSTPTKVLSTPSAVRGANAQ